MTTYKNTYFRLLIEFPDSWKLTSWRHMKISRSRQAMYQSRDDDLPSGECVSKFLFTAALHPAKNEVLIDADIELSIFRLSEGEKMRASLINNFERQRAYYESNGIETLISDEGVWALGEWEFGYVDQVSTSKRRKSRYRFIFHQWDPVLWLYGKIAGHEDDAYKEALDVVRNLQSNAGIG